MNYRSVWRPSKDEVVAKNGAVASLNPLATEVGINILKAGGNAIDATVGMGFCLAVVEPMMSSIAGHGQMLLHFDGKPLSLDYSHRAPKAATSDMYTVSGDSAGAIGIFSVEDRANEIGYQSVGVPGVTAGLCDAHKLFGTLPLEQLLEPAVHYAENGFTSDWFTSLCISDAMASFVKYGEAGKTFLFNGYPPISETDRVVQRDLGYILRQIAKKGKSALYEGEIPRAVEDDMKQKGGLLRVEDFTDYQVQICEPLGVAYRGHEIIGMPMVGGGITELQTLNILENVNIDSLEHNSPEMIHLFLEITRHAFSDRYYFLGDPEFVNVPIRSLLSKSYAKSISKQINRDHTSFESQLNGEPWLRFLGEAPHLLPECDEQTSQLDFTLNPSYPSSEDCTTHFGVIDGNHNMVACTQTSVGNFGSAVITPGTGILFSNGMLTFNPTPGAANSIAGFKRSVNNMGPLLVLREGSPYLNLGAPGGRKIINCVTQIVMNVLDYKMGIQEAITAPRVDGSGKMTLIDSRIDHNTIRALLKKGHSIEVVDENPAKTNFARPVGLMIDPQSGNIHAGADVFRNAQARGY